MHRYRHQVLLVYGISFIQRSLSRSCTEQRLSCMSSKVKGNSRHRGVCFQFDKTESDIRLSSREAVQGFGTVGFLTTLLLAALLLRVGMRSNTTTHAFGLMKLASHTRSLDDRQLVRQRTFKSIYRRRSLDSLAFYDSS